jgi:hypothetical protein
MAKRMTKADRAALVEHELNQQSARAAERRRAHLLSLDAEDRAFAERAKKRIHQQVFGRQNFHEEGKPSS